jgi:hypothetical protein
MKVKHLLVFPHKLGMIYSKNHRDNEGEMLASFPPQAGHNLHKIICRGNEMHFTGKGKKVQSSQIPTKM